MTTVYLGLGSNLGDRRASLRDALDTLEAPDLHIGALSPIYETEPLEVVDQPWFLNLVAEAATTLSPIELLARLQDVERTFGRRRTIPKGPRTLDIDILYYGRLVLDTPELTIPHPRVSERRFVLVPLADIAPGLRDPRTGRTVLEMIEEAPAGQVVRRISE